MRRRILAVCVAALATIGLVAASTGSADASSRRQVGYTQVVVAPAVYQLISGAGIAPAAIAPGTAAPFKGTLAARFPITGYSLSNVRIKHAGGISLTAGTSSISLSEFYIDLGRLKVSANVSGSVVGSVGRADLFTIGFSNRYDLGLVRLRLTDTAAGALNATFGVQAFKAGDTFGYATPRPFSSLSGAANLHGQVGRISR